MIRKAKKTDAKLVAPLLYNALHEIAEKITGSTDEAEVLLGLETWFSKENNRLSYENCFVYEQDESAVGVIVAYHGSEATQLDAPIVHHLRELHKDESITLEKEAELDEYYMDTLSVSSVYGGKGIGSKLFNEVEKIASGVISLEVRVSNTNAIEFYSNRDELINLDASGSSDEIYNKIKELI